MTRYFLLAFVSLILAGCKTNEPTAVSPTVQPSDPNSIAGSGSTPAPAGYQSTSNASTQTGMQSTYSGLQYQVLSQGTGKRPSSFNKVKVHYTGTLTNGTVFDSSRQRGQPATFGVGQVIPGWTEGLQLMQEGARYKFIIPPNLGYGARGAPPKIGPNETLIFDVELLEVLY